jgi:putative FmdB family regulatory protein
MPTYEYRCAKGHSFELFQKMSDLPARNCPECGSPAERVVSGGAGFVFKGAGFYITETRSEDYKKKAQNESPGSDPSPGKGEKSEKKGEQKADRSDKSEKSEKSEKKEAPAPKPPHKSSGGDQ